MTQHFMYKVTAAEQSSDFSKIILSSFRQSAEHVTSALGTTVMSVYGSYNKKT